MLNPFKTYKLRSGRLFIEDHGLIYELDHPVQQIYFSQECHEILELLLVRPWSIRNMAQDFYSKKSQVPFKLLISTFEKLLEEDAIVEETAVNVRHESPSRVYQSSVMSMDFVIFRRLSLPFKIPGIIFYMICAGLFWCTMVALLKSYQPLSNEYFLLISNRYDVGFIFALVAISALVSLKNVLSLILCLVSAGRAYSGMFRVTPFSITFHFDDAFYFQTANKSHISAYFLVTSVIYLLTSAVLSLNVLHPQISYHVNGLAIILTLCALNPYGYSQAHLFIKSFFTSDGYKVYEYFLKHRLLLELLRPINFIRTQRTPLMVAAATAVWATLSMFCLFTFFMSNWPKLFLAIESGSLEQAAGAALVAATFVVPMLFLGSSYLIIIAYNLLEPAKPFLTRMHKFFGTREVRLIRQNRLRELVKSTPIFFDLPETGVIYLLAKSKVVSFLKDVPILAQGSTGNEVYLLLSGGAEVRRREGTGLEKTLATLYTGSIFGEMAMFDQKVRTASVIASEYTYALMIQADAFATLFTDPEHKKSFQKAQERILISQYLSSHPMFLYLPHETVQLFYQSSILEEIPENYIVFEQGSFGQDLYFVLRGSVQVEINGAAVHRIPQGGFFGEMALLKPAARSATIITLEGTSLLKISAQNFWEILVNNIEIAIFFESIAELRALENKQIIAEPLQEGITNESFEAPPMASEAEHVEEVTQILPPQGPKKGSAA